MVTTRTEIIQRLIDKNGYQSYLEIGVQQPANNFNKIKCGLRIGVDPDPNARATYAVTSDEYFKLAIKIGTTHDIIFIDGLHEADQVQRDIENSLRVLSPNGCIVCHDMVPINEAAQKVPRETKQWNGDCWKAFVRLRERDDLHMITVDCDFGCGVIKRGKQEPVYRDADLTYENFVKYKQRWMNLVSPDYFERMYL